jgi:hypothetical protein
LYTGPLMDLQEIGNYYQRHPEQYNGQMMAVSRILQCWLFHVLTDVYGDIPYSQALQVDVYPLPEFDRGNHIYAALLASLKAQIDVLDVQSQADIAGDILGNGNREYWIKLANALRMRIAMRMADVNPAEARNVIEEAARRTLNSVRDDVYFPYNGAAVTNRFPYNEAERPLTEFALTTTLIDYMSMLDDPRLPVYARPDVNTNQYRGKPYGLADNRPLIDSLSKPGEKMYSADGKGYIITYAEVAFLKAEAAARGMNVGGIAAWHYQEGVRASMQQWGITDKDLLITKYLRKVPYRGGRWQDVIGSQKWIALYMQGLQAWMERLRLDFVKPDGTPLFILPVSGSLDPELTDVPQRLNYPNATRNSNAANVADAVLHMGRDSKATKNWWNIR